MVAMGWKTSTGPLLKNIATNENQTTVLVQSKKQRLAPPGEGGKQQRYYDYTTVCRSPPGPNTNSS